MRVTRQCVKCIVNVRLNEVLNAVKNESRSIELQVELLKVIHEEFIKGNELTVIASRIYSWLVNRSPKVVEYYRIVKRKSIDRAKHLIGELEDYLKYFDGYERFRLAIKISVAGNILDTGVYEHKPPATVSRDYILSIPLVIDHTLEFYNDVVNGGKVILWLFDNAGEAIYDLLAIKLLREYGNKVVGVVKDDPGFQNDLTLSDALYARINEHVDELITTGYPGSSIHLDLVSQEFKEKLKQTDIIISKGMAHYEYLSEVNLGKPIFYLLIPKCEPIAKSLNVEKGTFVALYKR